MRISKPAVARACRIPAGFTLVELLVTMAILAILTAIAYPSYRDYVLRGKVTAATNALASMYANLERYYQDNRQYNSVTPGTPPLSPCDSTVVPRQYDTFTVTCNVVNGSNGSFTVTATGANATAGFVYTIDSNDVQASTVGAPAPAAWILNCPSSWETRAGSC